MAVFIWSKNGVVPMYFEITRKVVLPIMVSWYSGLVALLVLASVSVLALLSGIWQTSLVLVYEGGFVHYDPIAQLPSYITKDSFWVFDYWLGEENEKMHARILLLLINS